MGSLVWIYQKRKALVGEIFLRPKWKLGGNTVKKLGRKVSWAFQTKEIRPLDKRFLVYMWKFSPWRGSAMPKVWAGWEISIKPLCLALALPLFLAFSFRAGAMTPNTNVLHPIRKASSGLECILTSVNKISVTSRFWIIIWAIWPNTRVGKTSEEHLFQCFSVSVLFHLPVWESYAVAGRGSAGVWHN